MVFTDNKNSKFYTSHDLDPIIEEQNITKSTNRISEDLKKINLNGNKSKCDENKIQMTESP